MKKFKIKINYYKAIMTRLKPFTIFELKKMKIKKIFSICLCLITLLTSCNVEDTVPSSEKFNADILSEHSLQNSKDKIFYFFSKSRLRDTHILLDRVKITAYDYANKKIIAEKEIGSYPGFKFNEEFVSIGMYNGEMELYFLDQNKIRILNAITLDEITNIEVPNADSLSGIGLEKNLIFVGASSSHSAMGLFIYDRKTLTQINHVFTGSRSRRLRVYYNKATDNIYSISFELYSNISFVSVDKFNSSGNHISSKSHIEWGNATKLRGNNNSNALITGSNCDVYFKSELSSSINNRNSLFQNSNAIDYRFNLDGSKLYVLKYVGTPNGEQSIDTYNTSDYTKQKSIEVNRPHAKYIYINEDEIILVHHSEYASDKNVYFSTYPK